MGRKAVTINPKKGERLRQLLQEYNVSQKEIASVLNYSPEQISYIINGKRNLTEPAAKEIIKYFNSIDENDHLCLPSMRKGKAVRFEWLMGYDDYKTEREKKEKDISTEQLAEVSQWHKYLELQKGRTEDSEHKAFDLYLNNSGFLKEMVMCIEGKPIGKVIWPLYHRTVKPRDIPGHDCVKDNARIKYKLTNEDSNECALIDSVLYNLAVKEIADFAEFKIKKLIEGSKADG